MTRMATAEIPLVGSVPKPWVRVSLLQPCSGFKLSITFKWSLVTHSPSSRSIDWRFSLQTFSLRDEALRMYPSHLFSVKSPIYPIELFTASVVSSFLAKQTLSAKKHSNREVRLNKGGLDIFNCLHYSCLPWRVQELSRSTQIRIDTTLLKCFQDVSLVCRWWGSIVDVIDGCELMFKRAPKGIHQHRVQGRTRNT